MINDVETSELMHIVQYEIYFLTYTIAINNYKWNVLRTEFYIKIDVVVYHEVYYE